MVIRKQNPKLKATKIPSNLEIAWAAGIFEGEGCCTTSGHGKRSFVVSVSQKDPELLYRLKDLFGGAIRFYKRGTHGQFGIFNWVVCGDLGRVFLTCIFQLLTARRKGQIAATSAYPFIREIGEVPDLNSSTSVVEFVMDRMDEYIVLNRADAKRKRKNYQSAFYEEHSLDPAWMEKRRNQTRDWRLRNKENQENGNVVSIKKNG